MVRCAKPLVRRCSGRTARHKTSLSVTKVLEYLLSKAGRISLEHAAAAGGAVPLSFMDLPAVMDACLEISKRHEHTVRRRAAKRNLEAQFSAVLGALSVK